MNMSCWVWDGFIRIDYIPWSFFFFLRFIMFWSFCFFLCIHRGVRCDSLDICQPCSGSAFMHSFLPIHGLGLDMGLWPRPQIFKEIFQIEENLSFMMKFFLKEFLKLKRNFFYYDQKEYYSKEYQRRTRDLEI